MFLLHFILPLVIYYFYRNKALLGGLLLGNLIDLDHVYARIIGKVGWWESACSSLGKQCSFNFYPLHNVYVLLFGVLLCSLIFFKNKKLKFFGFLGVGIVLNLALDYIHLWVGWGI